MKNRVVMLAIGLALVAQPAMASSSARWESQPVTQSVSLSGKDLRETPTVITQQLSAKINHVIYKDVVAHVEEMVPAPAATCSVDLPTLGANWQTYFYDLKHRNLSQAAIDLTTAIMGLDLRDAQTLIFNGYFRDSNLNWNDLVSAINSYADQIKKPIAYKILVTNAETNIQNLGYTCGVADGNQVNMLVETVVAYTDQTITSTANFIVNISGGALLKGEKEIMDLTYSAYPSGTGQVSFESDFNDYRVVSSTVSANGGSVTINVQGTRKLITPPNTLDTSKISISNGNGNMVINGLADKAYDASLKDLGKMVLVVEVKANTGFLGWPVTVKKVEIPVNLTNSPQSIDTGIAPPAGKNAFAYISLKYVGSKYYNDQATGTFLTKGLKF